MMLKLNMKSRMHFTMAVLCNICAIQLIYISFLFYISTKYVLQYHEVATFLQNVNAIPLSSEKIFAAPFLLYPILLGVLYLQHRVEPTVKNQLIFLTLEIFLCMIIFRLISFSANELIFLVVANFLTLTSNQKMKGVGLAVLISVLVFTNYNVISSYINVASFDNYLVMYNSSAVHVFQSLLAMLSGMITVVFVVYILFLIQNQVTETLLVQQENIELTELTHTLREMADMRETMGETKERNRLAREIHDTLGHTLTGLATGLDSVRAILVKRPDLAEKQLAQLSAVAKEGLSDVRRSVKKLRPDALESHSLEEALENMMDDFRDVTGTDIHYVCHLESLRFQADEEDAIYRIVQESMTNSVRHGHATKIYVTFAKEEDTLIIIIEDNGVGCDEIHEGFGLHHMKERINLLSGSVHYYSHNGFTVFVEIPIRKEERDD